MGDKENPLNRVSRWKIKINKDKKDKTNSDIYIGISNKAFKGTSYQECWSNFSHRSKIRLSLKGKYIDFNECDEK